VATAAYFFTVGGLALSLLAALAQITGPALGLITAVSVLSVHIGYGAITRTYWACAVCLALPVIGLLLPSILPDDDPDVDWGAVFAYGAVVLAPCVAALVAVGVAAGRRVSRPSSYQ
jgi:hypothetical protein